MPLARILETRPRGRPRPITAGASPVLKRRIVLHVLRAPHGEIAVAVDETRACGHRYDQRG